MTQPKAPTLSRRGLLARGAALVAAPMIIPASALGAGRPAPSNRINLALIGCGGMGGANTNGLLHQDDVQIVGVCDVDSQRRADLRRRIEEHYAEQTSSGGYHGCAEFHDFRDVLAREDIEAVVIATPDHWHVPIATAAARAAKDIYCEKPLTLTIAQGRLLADAVKRYGRVLQVGSQQRSDARFRKACELVRNGRIGELHRIEVHLPPNQIANQLQNIVPPDFTDPPPHLDYDFWLGPAPWEPFFPGRCHGSFRWNLDYSGGMLTDWGAHHLDIAQWGLGEERGGPVEIEGTGVFPTRGPWTTAVTWDITYRYAGGVEVHCTPHFTNGVRFIGSQGDIFVNRSTIESTPAGVIHSTIRPDEIHLPVSHGGHHRNWLDCIRSRREPVAPVEIGHRSVTTCHLGNIAMLLHRRLRWDPAREAFENDDEANRMCRRAARSPWHI